MDEKQLAKLIRKNAAKAEQNSKSRRPRVYDRTLEATKGASATQDEAGIEREQFFKEMKRREF